MYTLDTNVILYYNRGEKEVCDIIDDALANGLSLYVSTITVAELFQYPQLTPIEEGGIRKVLSLCSIITIDMSIAERAGRLGATHKQKLADSIVAATALFTSSTLVTRNVRDFKRVAGLRIEAI